MTDIQLLGAVVWCLWIGGCILLAALGASPAARRTIRPMWPQMMSSAVVIAFASVPLLLGVEAATLFFAIAVVRIGWECGEIRAERFGMATRDRRVQSATMAGVLLAVATTGFFLPVELAFPCLAVTGLFFVWSLQSSRRGKVHGLDGRIPGLVGMLVYPGLPVLAFAACLASEKWHAPVFLAFILVEVFDSFSLLGGKLFGRRPLIPRVSANKTVEGLLTGLAALLVVASGLGLVMDGVSLFISVLVAFGVGLAAFAGDFLASVPKRAAGVKDYPVLMKQQGGLLDIMDAWLLAGPVVAMIIWMNGAA